MTDLDALSEFCAGLTPADVERERLAPLSRARLESFGGVEHRNAMAVHDLNRAKAMLRGVVATPASLQAQATLQAAEYARDKAKRAKLRRWRVRAARKAAARKQPARVYTREQIDAALAQRGRAS